MVLGRLGPEVSTGLAREIQCRLASCAESLGPPGSVHGEVDMGIEMRFQAAGARFMYA